MDTNSHELGEEGELGEFNEKEIAEAAAATENKGEKPEQIEAAADAVAEAAKQDRENRALLKIVRESAEEMLDTFENDPKSIDMLADAYVGSVVNARVQLGRSEDEEGVRMMLGAAVKAIGDRKGVANSDELIKKISGSAEAVKEWVDANMPKPSGETVEFKNEDDEALKLTDAEIDEALAKLDKAVESEKPPGAENEQRA